MNKVIRLADKLRKIDKHWTPGIIAALNNYHIKLVKIFGEFTWHSHADTDELFLVLHEPADTINTGDTPGELTVEQPIWL